jgi:F-type H+-transporting ATPase subunit a
VLGDGVSVTSPAGPIETLGEATGPQPGKRSPLRIILILAVIVVVIDVLALLFVPPFPAGGQPGDDCSFPECFIQSTLHLPAPHVVWTPSGDHGGDGMILAEVSLTDSLLTMIIITVLVLVGLILMTRSRAAVPGRVQNFIEWAIESLEGFAKGMGGHAAARYVPMFAAFFILILAFNWSGLIPIVGRVEGLRAPTSDVNVTIGLALVAFFTFHIEGVRRLGLGGYLSKFFPVYEFKNGVGAGVIAMFVGIIELMLEFVKPLTLSMRLFGNIYGGEVALGVVTALTLAVLPVALYGLEIMLTFVQALIFSTLALMFTIAAIESHHHEEGEAGHEAAQALGDAAHPRPAAAH